MNPHVLGLPPAANQTLDQLLQWHHEVGELGFPRFGEFGWRLTDLSEQLMAARETDSPSISALQVAQLEGLIAKLHLSEPPFTNWEEPLEELMRILRQPSHPHRVDTALA